MDPILVISLLVLGAGIGLAAGLLGIGGGMILVPFLTFLLPLFGVPQELAVHASIATAMASTPPKRITAGFFIIEIETPISHAVQTNRC